MSAKIRLIKARDLATRQEFSGLGNVGVEARVETETGAFGVGVATAGFSVGKHETNFVNVMTAVNNINNIIGLALKGEDCRKQKHIDELLLALDGTKNKSRLGGNALASVSAAVLKAGAASLELPLYRYIGGINACVLPVPGVIVIDGGNRYGGGQRAGNKPSYSFIAYGFNNFKDASFACNEIREELERVLRRKFNAVKSVTGVCQVQQGSVQHDTELLDAMVEAIENLGYHSRVGIQADVAASTYLDSKKNKFVGLFSKKDKTRDELIDLYKDLVRCYPFVIIEDPLDEDDFEGHALLTRDLGIEIVGDDLFATNSDRLKKGIKSGACNTILLKVNQIGTFSEALDVIRLAYNNGYAVMPCGSRGEGADIADYSVGLNTGQIREGGVGPTAKRLLEIETELAENSIFLGKKALEVK